MSNQLSELKNGAKLQDGVSNTVLSHLRVSERDRKFLEETQPLEWLWLNDSTGIRHLPKGTVNVFCDFLVFHTSKCELSRRGLEIIKYFMVEGRYFLDKNGCKGKTGYEIKQYDYSGQIYEGSSKTWNYCIENTLGVKLFVSENVDYVDALRLEFSGEPLSHLMPRNNILMVCGAIKLMCDVCPNIKVSRFDASMDVSHDLLDILAVYECQSRGEFSGVRKTDAHLSTGFVPMKKLGYCDEDKGWVIPNHEFNTGLTVYFGSKNSRNKRFKVYETYVKHGYHAVRLELKQGDEWCKEFVARLMAQYECYLSELEKDSYTNDECRMLKQSVGSRLRKYIIDWVLSPNVVCLIKTKLKPSNRGIFECYEQCVYDFWDNFRKTVRAAQYKITFEREETPIQRKMRWFQRVSSNFMLGILGVFGDNGLMKLLYDFMDLARSKDKHRLIGVTGITDNLDKTQKALLDCGDKECGDNPWIGMLPDDFQKALRTIKRLNGYPEIFVSDDDYIFPVMKNKECEFYRAIRYEIEYDDGELFNYSKVKVQSCESI